MRRSFNWIDGLMDGNGDFQIDQANVDSIVLQYFASLFLLEVAIILMRCWTMWSLESPKACTQSCVHLTRPRRLSKR